MCRLCDSKDIDISVISDDEMRWFSSKPAIGLMYCPLCRKKIERVAPLTFSEAENLEIFNAHNFVVFDEHSEELARFLVFIGEKGIRFKLFQVGGKISVVKVDKTK